ncbi:MAG TPA: hypothetical protein VEW06_06320 [Xanthobacteraceae bacterium]|nr:hypothetical protein [Xanthobacteraceae bacterium]
MTERILGKGEVVGSIPTGSTTFPLIKSATYGNPTGTDSGRDPPAKSPNRIQIRAKSVQLVQPSPIRSHDRIDAFLAGLVLAGIIVGLSI